LFLGFGTGILIEPPITTDEKEPPDELVVIPMEECLSTVTVEDESMLRVCHFLFS